MTACESSLPPHPLYEIVGRMASGNPFKRIAAFFRRKPGMTGTPPSARGLSPIPANAAEHASALALEWEDVAEAHTRKRMRELGIPEHQIGAPEYRRGGEKHAFLPKEMIGGSNAI